MIYDTANNDSVAALQKVDYSILSPNTSCSPCKGLANLEKSICTGPAKLEKKRAELKREINRVHSPFIRMIPPEIIAMISEFVNTDFTIIRRLPACILLSSVCSDWRRTVVGTPRLWSSIKINLYSFMTCSKLRYFATFIDQWLGRSGQLALHISVYSDYKNVNFELHPGLRKIFKILNQYSFRWHTLNIDVHPIILGYLWPDQLPLLEQLNVNSQPHRDFRDREYRVIKKFPSTPRLKTVGVINMSPFDLKIQWDNVTRLSIKHLDDIVFNNIKIRWDKVTHISTVSMETGDGVKIVLPLLGTLALSNLSSLKPLMACLKRSACSLHTLSLDLLLNDINGLLELLKFLSPSLTKLVISRRPIHTKDSDLGEYLSILTKTYSSQKAITGDSFLPHLEIFEYREVSQSSIDFFDSANLPAWCSNGPIPLCSAYIDLRAGHSLISQDILSILQQLNKDRILNISSTGDQNVSLGAALKQL